MKDPFFSIIVAFYNQLSLIEETIKSIYDQGFESFEIIVVNDGSDAIETEGVNKLILNDYSDKVKILYQENSGPGSARNRGAEEALGEYIIFVDGDDLMSENSLKRMHEYLLKNQQVDVLIGDNTYFGERVAQRLQKIPVFPSILTANAIILCAAVRRSKFNDQLHFEPKLDRVGLEDWEFWINALKHELHFEHIPEFLFKIRVQSSSRTYVTANKQKDQAFQIVYGKHASLVHKYFEAGLLENKQLKTSINIKIGNHMLSPYRFIKGIFNRGN